MNYAAEWNAEHASREMRDVLPLAAVRQWFEPWKDKEVSILDIGCGQGTNTLWLRHMGFRVFGFDSSPAAVKWLMQAVTGSLTPKRNIPSIIVADATKPWPYHAGSFDVAFDVRVLENLNAEEVQFAYKEVGRVLRPDGVFCCLTASQARPDSYTTVGKVRRTSDLDLADWLMAANMKIAHISREYEGTLEDWNVQAIRQ